MSETVKEKKEYKKMFAEAGILFAITLIAGILLGFVHELTKKPIADKQRLKIEAACGEVFEGGSAFEEIDPLEEEAGQSADAAEQYAAENGVKLGQVYRALDGEGTLMGYVLTVTSSRGYGGDIKLLMGVKLDGSLSGIAILEISETPGLGMRAEEVLVPQFAGRQVPSFTYTKDGAVADSEIDAISGATITTGAVTDAVNTGLMYFQTVLQEGGDR